MFSQEETTRIAGLARIELSAEETADFARQITEVLDYFKIIDQADLTLADSLPVVNALENVWQEDVVLPVDANTREKILEAAPQREGDYLAVKAIFKD